jgi:hypothetical protein
MARYGYGISVSGSRTPVVASSTPAPNFGLPAQIIVTGAGAANGTYTKTSSAGVYTPEPNSGTFNYLLGAGFFYITSPGNTNYNGDYADNDWVLANGNDSAAIYSENTSTDANNVPTTSWSPSITITAV